MNLQLVVVFLAFVQVNRQQSTTSTCGQRCPEHTLSQLPRIPNGFEADRLPWHTAIYDEYQSFSRYECGGTLISSNLILTAGHCTSKYNHWILAGKDFVSLGRLRLDDNDRNSQSFEVIFHYQFSIHRIK